MFSGASNFTDSTDKAFLFIFIIAFVFIIGITAFMIYMLIHFSRKKGKAPMQFSSNTKLEIVWTVIPLILVMLMFYVGLKGYAPMRRVPADAMKVTAIGRMWEWEFDYGNGLKSKELVLPVNKAVKIDLVSEDVNHSFFIPAFRVKQDVIRGYNNYLWFIPNYIGDYEILCSEYCGLLHSAMVSKTRIVAQEDFDKWFAELKTASLVPEPAGLVLLRNTGCLACHSLDGTKLVGPSFKGLYGAERDVISGTVEKTVKADDTYIINSIYDPGLEVVAGYPKGLMKSYKSLLLVSDISIITDYLKTLNESGK